MSRSSGEAAGLGAGRAGRAGRRRAQVEPLAALAAVFAVVVGLGVYAGALDAAVPAPREERLAPTALDAVVAAASGPTGAVAPTRLPAARHAGPAARRLNATLHAAGRRWTTGPPVPRGADDRASRRVTVRLPPGRRVVGRLRVVVR